MEEEMNKKAIELINELISDSEEKTNEYALYANDSHKMLDMVYYRGLSHGVKYVINKLDELKQLLTEEGKEVEFIERIALNNEEFLKLVGIKDLLIVKSILTQGLEP